MKLIVLTFVLFALVATKNLVENDIDIVGDLYSCIEQKCPTQYQKCKATSGCEDKLRKCEAKCGQKVNQICWSFCLGGPGAAADVALCAVNQGCLANSAS